MQHRDIALNTEYRITGQPFYRPIGGGHRLHDGTPSHVQTGSTVTFEMDEWQSYDDDCRNYRLTGTGGWICSCQVSPVAVPTVAPTPPTEQPARGTRWRIRLDRDHSSYFMTGDIVEVVGPYGEERVTLNIVTAVPRGEARCDGQYVNWRRALESIPAEAGVTGAVERGDVLVMADGTLWRVDANTPAGSDTIHVWTSTESGRRAERDVPRSDFMRVLLPGDMLRRTGARDDIYSEHERRAFPTDSRGHAFERVYLAGDMAIYMQSSATGESAYTAQHLLLAEVTTPASPEGDSEYEVSFQGRQWVQREVVDRDWRILTHNLHEAAEDRGYTTTWGHAERAYEASGDHLLLLDGTPPGFTVAVINGVDYYDAAVVHADVAAWSAACNTAANDNGLCGEYEQVINRINRGTRFLELAPRMRRSVFTIEETYTIRRDVPVEAPDDELETYALRTAALEHANVTVPDGDTLRRVTRTNIVRV